MHAFPIFGLPEQIVSDNGSQFVSKEFSIFSKNNGIKHMHRQYILHDVLDWIISMCLYLV